VCEFLDASVMGQLEVCGRHSLGDAQRAWATMARGIHRQHLEGLTSKQLVHATIRARSLYPRSPEAAERCVVPPINNNQVSFDDFVFTVVLTSNATDDSEFRVDAFEHMRLTAREDDMGDFRGITNLMMHAPPDTSAHVELSRIIKSLHEHDSPRPDYVDAWSPTAHLIAIRKADGTAVKVAHFAHTLNENVGEFGTGSYGSLTFDNGTPLLWDDGEVDYHMILIVMCEMATGHARAFCFAVAGIIPQRAGENMPNEILHALLNRRCDESLRVV